MLRTPAAEPVSPSRQVLLPTLLAGAVLVAIACAPPGEEAPTGDPAAQAAAPAPPITDLEWRVVEVRGRPVETEISRGAPTLTLASAEGRASGFAGCNQFTGSFALSGSRLTFGALAMTRMFCDGRMELEEWYSRALGDVTNARISEGALELLAGDSVVVRAHPGG